MPFCVLTLHFSSAVPLHFISALFLTNDLTAHPSVFNNSAHFFPIFVSLLLSPLHCGILTPRREDETVSLGEREGKQRKDIKRGRG